MHKAVIGLAVSALVGSGIGIHFVDGTQCQCC